MNVYPTVFCLILCLFIQSVLLAQCPREVAIDDYNNIYLPSAFDVSDMQWTGDVNSCDPGTISQSVKDKITQRINYFRALVGVTNNITLDATKNGKCQEAALMQNANGTLDHCTGMNGAPCNNWNCSTADAIEASQKSNLGAGNWTSFNPINQWIQDSGNGNQALGHRRWILYSRAQEMGIGLTPNYSAQWVIGDFTPTATYDEFIAYPPNGYIIRDLVYARWSFNIPGADFSSATVTITDQDNNNVPVNIISINGGFGDPVIAFEPVGIITDSDEDVKYTVTVANIAGAAQTSYTYDVWIIPPVYPPMCPTGQEWNEGNCACEAVQTCLIGDVSAAIRCVDANTYEADITISYFNPPGSGTLTVNGQHFSISSSPQTVTLTNLTADGNPVDLNAEFSAEPTCSLTENALFSAPESGSCSYTCPVGLSADVPKPLPNYANINSRIDIGLDGIITDVNIVNLQGYIDFPQFFVSMSLTSPTGTMVDLLQSCNNSTYESSNFDIIFDDEAATPVPCNFTTGNAFQPVSNLSDFDGENAAGVWTLNVQIPYESGTTNRSLDSWGLEICGDFGNEAVCTNAPPVSGNITTGTYHVANTISSNGTIPSNANVVFKAGNSITLGTNFTVQNGATFLATIEDCTNAQPSTRPSFAIDTPELITPPHLMKELGIYPNPSRGEATITYYASTPTEVSISIFDINGKEVQQLMNQQEVVAGDHQVFYRPSTQQEGIYLVVLRTKDKVVSKRLILVK